MEVLSALCLCAGIGGIELGLSLVANVEPVCFVESDPYCQRVLKARYPNAFLWDDVTTFPAKEWGGVDIVTAGFPCQPWSLAGSRKGQEDDRWLWPRIAEIVRRVQPRFVFLENVPGLLSGERRMVDPSRGLVSGSGLGSVLGDLAALGFHAEWGVFSCAGMGAPQRRERVFVLAYRDDCERALLRTGEPEAGRGDRILAYSNSADLRQQPIANPRGSGEAEPGRTLQDLENSDRLRGGRGLRERAAETEGPSGFLEHPESLQRGQRREAKGKRQGRSVRADSTVAHPDQQRLEERPSPGRDRPEELETSVGGGAELADSEGPGERIPDEQGQIDADPRGANHAVWPPGPEGDWGSIKAEFWPVEPGVCRVVNGPADRLERSDRRARLKALGNSVSAIVSAAAWTELTRRIKCR